MPLRSDINRLGLGAAKSRTGQGLSLDGTGICFGAHWQSLRVWGAISVSVFCRRTSDCGRYCHSGKSLKLKGFKGVVMTDKSPLFALVLFAVYFIFSTLIPPLQSPDEYEHVKRAYFLAEGAILLNSPEGQSSGGMIDVGLNSYINSYSVLNGKSARKLSGDEVSEANSIQWTGQKMFSPAPGTGYYLPIVYLPQAIGLKIGESFGFSIDESYRIARLAGLLVASLIIFISFRLHSPSPLVMALLLMPMSLFQMSSTSLDVMSTALAILTVSLYFRLIRNSEQPSNGLMIGLALSLFLLICSKINTLPLIGLLFFVGLYTKNRKGLIAGIIVLVGVFAWLVIAVKTTVDLRLVTGASTSSIVLFYLKNPFAFFEVLARTLPGYGMGYAYSFIGVLGWLDTILTTKAYNQLCILLLGVLICSVSFKSIYEQRFARGGLALCALASVLLVFFALLVTWNVHPASIIEGVQGRYFLIPALLLAYTIGGAECYKKSLYSVAGLGALLFMFLFSGYITSNALLNRYYIVNSQQTTAQTQLLVSPPLTPDTAINLGFSQKHQADSTPLKRIGVMFGTYARENPGDAELRLTTEEGKAVSQRFALADLTDNQYHYFDLHSGRYVQGEIVSVTGGGVSVWEGRAQPEDAHACVIYEYIDGRKILSVGCPAPNQ